MLSKETKEFIPIISAYFRNEPVVRAWLFGSCSRGEETKESDIDLLVDYDENARLSLFKICGMMVELEDLLGRKVDLVENRGLMDFARPSVERDKILIYERTA